jgi:hypothetical protein
MLDARESAVSWGCSNRIRNLEWRTVAITQWNYINAENPKIRNFGRIGRHLAL